MKNETLEQRFKTRREVVREFEQPRQHFEMLNLSDREIENIIALIAPAQHNEFQPMPIGSIEIL